MAVENETIRVFCKDCAYLKIFETGSGTAYHCTHPSEYYTSYSFYGKDPGFTLANEKNRNNDCQDFSIKYQKKRDGMWKKITALLCKR